MRRMLAQRTRWLFVATGVVVIGVMGALFYYAASQYEIQQAEHRIRDVMLESRALHYYTQHDMLPTLSQAKREDRVPEVFYAPELFSSTYIARNLYAYYNDVRKASGLPEVKYRLAAINPRNAVNAPDEFERSLIERFNADRTMTEYREIIEIDGRKHLFYAVPFLPVEQRCLKCHGAPEGAPKELRDYYHWTGGYGREVGDIFAMESISTPLKGEFNTAQIMLAVFLSVAVLVTSLFFVNTRLRGLVREGTRSLQEKEMRLERILETAQAGIVLVDAQSREIVEVNASALRMIGASKEAVIGRRCDQVLCPAGQQECPILDHGEKSDNSEQLLVRADGRTVPILKTVVPLMLHSRQYLLESFLDITDRKHAEEQKSRLEDQLRQSQKMEAVGRLAGGIAHDFNNLLMAIMGNAELAAAALSRSPDKPGPVRRSLEQITEVSERAASLVRQLLAFSRKEMPRPNVLDPAEVVSESDRMLRRLIGQHVDMKVTVEAGVDRVRADERQLEQALMNLVVNACDAMPDGGELRIDVCNVAIDPEHVKRHPEARPGPHVMIAVADTGTGMGPETMAHLFEPFFTTKPVDKGTGLGLATVYGIVTEAGGHIVVESEQGRGSVFRVYLPAEQPAPPALRDEATGFAGPPLT